MKGTGLWQLVAIDIKKVPYSFHQQELVQPAGSVGWCMISQLLCNVKVSHLTLIWGKYFFAIKLNTIKLQGVHMEDWRIGKCETGF